MSRIPDRELIKQSIDGDSQDFATLIKRVETTMVRLVRSEIPDPASAEDVLQEVLLDVWQGLKGLRDPDRWAAWVMQIARNRCHDFFRSAQRREMPMANSDLEPILNNEENTVAFSPTCSIPYSIPCPKRRQIMPKPLTYSISKV